MAIITSDTALDSIVKGTPATFTLSKSQLVANSVVTASAYYSDTDNWKKVILAYESATGNQKETVVFDATLATPTASFTVSTQAFDIFEIQKIEIYDFDGGHFPVYRADLVTADFDVDTTAAPAVEYTRDYTSPNSIQGFESFNTGFGGAFSFVAGGVQIVTTGSGTYLTHLNTDFAGASIPTDTYTLRVHIDSYTGTDDLGCGLMDSATVASPTVSATLTPSELTAAIGSYVDVSIVGTSQSSYLYALSLQSGGGSTIVISKVEILPYP